MRDTLFIHLRDPAAHGLVSYVRRAAEAETPTQSGVADLNAILSQAAGDHIVVFVPAADVRLLALNLPLRQASKALQAAPYALEEQLADDVETLHFALGEPLPEQGYTVAVTARALMDGWLAPFAAHHLKPQAVIPDVLGLPFAEGEWTGVVETHGITLRTGAASGLSCGLAELPGHLAFADPKHQMRLQLHVCRDVSAPLDGLQQTTVQHTDFALAVELLAQQWPKPDAINLLQGDYAQREDWQRFVRPWRTAAILAALAFGITTTGLVLQAWRSAQELAALQQHNIQRFQELFPTETPGLDLARQVAGLEQQLRAGGGVNPLFPLMEVLSTALKETPGLNLQSLQFREGALFLRLAGNDLQTLEALRAWFAGRQDAVLEVQAANAGTDGVQIRVKVGLRK